MSKSNNYTLVILQDQKKHQEYNEGIADQQKAGKQGRDDSIKQVTIQLPIRHLFP